MNASADAPDLARALAFSGQRVLITGGTKGLGRGIAQRFAEAGAGVVVCGRRPPESEPVGDFIAADVRDPDSVAVLFGAIDDRYGRLDVLVNNAGGAPPAARGRVGGMGSGAARPPPADSATASAKFSNAIIGLNLVAPLLCAQAA